MADQSSWAGCDVMGDVTGDVTGDVMSPVMSCHDGSGCAVPEQALSFSCSAIGTHP